MSSFKIHTSVSSSILSGSYKLLKYSYLNFYLKKNTPSQKCVTKILFLEIQTKSSVLYYFVAFYEFIMERIEHVSGGN